MFDVSGTIHAVPSVHAFGEHAQRTYGDFASPRHILHKDVLRFWNKT